MEFTLENQIKAPKHVGTYKLYVEFSEGDSIKVFTTDKDLLELLITTYDNFSSQLKEDWNSCCNSDYKDVQGYFEAAKEQLNSPIEIGEDFHDGYWSGSHEYDDYKSLIESWKLSYYDNNGVEYSIKVEK